MPPRQWEELTDEFDAESEDGQKFWIREYTTMMDASTMGGTSAPPLAGLKRYRPEPGVACNHLGEDTFEIEILSPRRTVRVTRLG